MRPFVMRTLTVLLLVVASMFVLSMGFWGCNGSSGPGPGLPGTPATRAQVLAGRYLVTSVAACADCHSSGKSPADQGWLGGFTNGTPGQPFMIGTFRVYPANLTPDAATGLGSWTVSQIFNALRTGKDKEGMFLCPPMPWPAFRNMSDADLWSIAAYLQSIKAVNNAVPASEGPGAPVGQHGDWSSAYAGLQPLPAWPAASENSLP